VCAGLGLAGQISVALLANPVPGTGLEPLIRFSTPFFASSLAATLYTTGFIAWRIIRVQRYAAKNGIDRADAGSDLYAVLEILVESAALYAASQFIFVVLLAMKTEKEAYIQAIHSQIAVCYIGILRWGVLNGALQRV
jgi:hypothetical protein